MRLRGSLGGDGAHFSLQKLYYLSVHTLDSPEGVKYAKNRVARELLDRWIDRKFVYAGLKFKDEEQVLTDTDS